MIFGFLTKSDKENIFKEGYEQGLGAGMKKMDNTISLNDEIDFELSEKFELDKHTRAQLKELVNSPFYEFLRKYLIVQSLIFYHQARNDTSGKTHTTSDVLNIVGNRIKDIVSDFDGYKNKPNINGVPLDTYDQI